MTPIDTIKNALANTSDSGTFIAAAHHANNVENRANLIFWLESSGGELPEFHINSMAESIKSLLDTFGIKVVQQAKCPCCKDTLDADEFSPATDYTQGPAAVERYGAMPCNCCIEQVHECAVCGKIHHEDDDNAIEVHDEKFCGYECLERFEIDSHEEAEHVRQSRTY